MEARQARYKKAGRRFEPIFGIGKMLLRRSKTDLKTLADLHEPLPLEQRIRLFRFTDYCGNPSFNPILTLPPRFPLRRPEDCANGFRRIVRDNTIIEYNSRPCKSRHCATCGPRDIEVLSNRINGMLDYLALIFDLEFLWIYDYGGGKAEEIKRVTTNLRKARNEFGDKYAPLRAHYILLRRSEVQDPDDLLFTEDWRSVAVKDGDRCAYVSTHRLSTDLEEQDGKWQQVDLETAARKIERLLILPGLARIEFGRDAVGEEPDIPTDGEKPSKATAEFWYEDGEELEEAEIIFRFACSKKQVDGKNIESPPDGPILPPGSTIDPKIPWQAYYLKRFRLILKDVHERRRRERESSKG
jgi:hypothetical protein